MTDGPEKVRPPLVRARSPELTGLMRVHMPDVTSKEYRAAFEIVVLVGQMIQARGSIPAGELYSDLMGPMPNLTANTFNQMIDKLIDAGVITRKNHLITWVGATGAKEDRKGAKK
jgi:hypothetical protein